MNEVELIEKIKKKRKDLGLSQMELAEKVGMKRQYIGALEQGERIPTIKTLVKICDALGLEVDLKDKDYIIS